ncbi:MAG: saccharopine dehydrogenase NADP-binding domain-containing protein, partial [Pseudomonadota bacterium]
MKNILLLGAGKIGAIISELLAGSGDYSVTVGDTSELSLSQLPKHPAIRPMVLDVTDRSVLNSAMQDQYAALSACPFNVTRYVAEAAADNAVHYLDLTEDVSCTRLVKSLAETAESALIPQCGLAPGFVTIAAYDLTKSFDTLHSVHMRTGALPKYPSNALKYNLTWSTDGLINEYCNPCEAIVEGRLAEVPPLEGLET